MKIRKFLKRFLQIFLILGFISAAGFFIWLLNITKPVAVEKKIETQKPLVEITPVKFEDITIQVPSKGLIQAKKRTQLSSELSGKVKSISDQFIVGGTFKEGETILEIESSDYTAALAQAEANLVEAEVTLTTELARAEQANRDWKRLGSGKPSALTLREPQIRNARSRVAASKAAVEKARNDLAKTVIRAPFNATVASKSTEIGNYLAPGSPLGEFFQTSPLEIRLPLALDEVRFLNSSTDGEIFGDVIIATALGNQIVEWKARIDRTEGQIDQQSRSIHLISDITSSQNQETPVKLQPGLFLTASIIGKTFPDIAKVPAAAFLDLTRVILVNSKNKLEFREVTVLRREGDYVYVSEGVNEGEKLCLTELSTMIEGTEVETRLRVPANQAKVEVNRR